MSELAALLEILKGYDVLTMTAAVLFGFWRVIKLLHKIEVEMAVIVTNVQNHEKRIDNMESCQIPAVKGSA